jgi:hypothetical protein
VRGAGLHGREPLLGVPEVGRAREHHRQIRRCASQLERGARRRLGERVHSGVGAGEARRNPRIHPAYLRAGRPRASSPSRPRDESGLTIVVK